jgi:ABC-type antimicrobial peptide transport system permease subunit
MFKNYFKTALRNIARYKIYSLINILGLTVGIACAVMIFVITQEEVSFNTHNNNADQIFRINKVYSMGGEISINESTPYPLANTVHETLPEVIEATHLVRTSTIIKCEDKVIRERNVYRASPSLFDMFTINIIEGDKIQPIYDINSIALSQSSATKYFGDESPIGKVLTLNSKNEMQVTAVYEDIPLLTDYSFDFIVHFDTVAEEDGYDDWYDHWMETFILVQPNTDVEGLQTKIDQLMKDNIGTQSGARLQSLRDTHLYSVEGNPTTQKYVYIFVSIAILILIIACINFMNLSTAQATKRAREVGVRKISGAQKWSLILQFIGESIIYTFIACLLSFVLIEISLPIFNQIVGRNITFSMFSAPIMGIYCIILLSVGIISGSYPAFVLSSFAPTKIFKSGYISFIKRFSLRTVIVVIQFTLAIALIIGTGIIYSQLHYMKNKDIGFNQDNILYIRLNRQLEENFEVFRNSCQQISSISNISRVSSIPNKVWNIMRGITWEGKETDEGSAFAFLSADMNILETLDLHVIKGRNFSNDMETDKDAVLINESAVRLMEAEDPLGIKLGDEGWSIIGVVNDFNSLPLTYEKEPLIIVNIPEYFYFVLLKLSDADVQVAIDNIKKVWHGVCPDFPFEYRFLDDTFQSTYETEVRAGILFRIFAGLGIFIACLGLFGLASFLAEQKKLEIGIRKVMGSTNKGIIWLLSRQFVRWIIIANVIAWPVAWFFMNKWLQGFAYRTLINPLIFLFAGILSLAIALLTISVKTLKAAHTNPAQIMKYE